MSLEKMVAHLVQQVEHRFYGKYRGFVVKNNDSERLGRLKLRIPSVLGNDVVTGWAMPCVAYGGEADQGCLLIPEVDAGVWVEFEEGDLEFPIWVGTFWSKPGGESELPKPNNTDGASQESVQDPPTRKIFKTKKGHTLQFEDKDDEEMVLIVEAKHGHVVVMNGDGVQITDGKNQQQVVLDSSGITISDKNDNRIIMSSDGIQIGSSEAAEPFVLGKQFMSNVMSFTMALSTHTHLGNMGAPTSPPSAPIQLQVPLSIKHKVE